MLGRAAIVFVPLWFVGAVIDVWIGVSCAGYSVADEAPIFPDRVRRIAGVATLLRWKLAGSRSS